MRMGLGMVLERSRMVLGHQVVTIGLPKPWDSDISQQEPGRKNKRLHQSWESRLNPVFE